MAARDPDGVNEAKVGEVIMSRHWDVRGGDRVLIDRADPRALLAAECLDEIGAGNWAPFVVLDGDQLDRLTFTDDFGHRYIYRLGEYDGVHDVWTIEWPD